MYAFYELNGNNGEKFYYRAGNHPLTGQFEFYMGVVDINSQKLCWQSIPLQCTGYNSDQFNYQLLTQPSGSSITVFLNPVTIFFNKVPLQNIHYTYLPIDLYHADQEDLQRYQNTLPPIQSSPVNFKLAKNKTPSKAWCDVNMQTLGIFVGILGAAAVCTAFVVINIVSGGSFAAILCVGLGVIAAGIGLFGAGYYRNSKSEEPMEPDNDLLPNY